MRFNNSIQTTVVELDAVGSGGASVFARGGAENVFEAPYTFSTVERSLQNERMIEILFRIFSPSPEDIVLSEVAQPQTAPFAWSNPKP